MPRRKILLDECVDRRLADHITGHEVETCHTRGWDGIKNGELLRLGAESFDIFLTVDRNLSFQQNISTLTLAVIVLHAPTNRLQDLLPLVPRILEEIPILKPGEINQIFSS